MALQKGLWPRQARSSHLLLLRKQRLGPALPPAAAAPTPCALSSQAAQRHRQTRARRGTRTKELSSQQLLVGFYPLSKFFTSTSGVFLSVKYPENDHGISDLINLNQPLTLALIKADIHTAGPVSPKEHYDITCVYIQTLPSRGVGR